MKRPSDPTTITINLQAIAEMPDYEAFIAAAKEQSAGRGGADWRPAGKLWIRCK